ncbi:hypothetical protein ABL78_0522 [Leptomonas seymouri]|uniref:Ribosomal RNA methyltransferase FtsJ domain-containing protein n=1 Tax=Leptomonas seymouri TaxID=5684 RepID=A0A0N0P8S5_LEPSE|nr:hypothetical protein ABL78_0522 [Leptomonas seymouri]|eukprot:KPI90296.1 hypothetical protein ABL78_0522 [Leptomonas seymouri]
MKAIYRCQSAYKLVELDARFHLFSRFRPHIVVDLAAAPGGFAQVALELMQKAGHQVPPPSLRRYSPMVIAVDQRPIEPLPGLVTVRGNILQHQSVLQAVQRTLHQEQSTRTASTELEPLRTVDMVLHDGVSVVKGQHAFSVTYAQNQMALSALLLASKLFHQPYAPHRNSGLRNGKRSEEWVKPHAHRHPSSCARTAGGSSSASALQTPSTLPVCFVSKVLRSPHFAQVVTATRALFHHVAVFKPQASRAESQETYVVATHFQPHHWQQLVDFNRHQRHRDPGARERLRATKSKYSPLEISPALFCMPPAVEDCGGARHIVWNCLGCGQTCMGPQPCVQCGVFAAARRAGFHRGITP